MRKDLEISDLIDRYLNNSLSVEDKSLVEEKIAFDLNFQEEFQIQKIANEATLYAELTDLRAQIGQDIEKIPLSTTPRTNKKWLFLLGIGLLSSILMISLYSSQNTPNEELKHYSKPEKKVNDEKSNQSNERLIPEAKELTLTQVRKFKSEPTLSSTQKSDIPEIIDTIKKEEVELKTTNTMAKEIPLVSISPPFPELENKIICNETVAFSSEASCQNNDNGGIILNSAPKETIFELSGTLKNNNTGSFYYLAPNKYTIKSTTQNGCIYTNHVVVNSKWCASNPSFSFNPSYNDEWKMEFNELEEGEYHIYNSQKEIIKKAQFKDKFVAWDGKDEFDNLLVNGNYRVIIKFMDGRIETAYITILTE